MKVAIIGAGPAGLIAADLLSAAGITVSLYDQAPNFGRKFLLAGRGGLNLTHSEHFDRFVDRYSGAKLYLKTIIADFNAKDLCSWCQELGQPTFIGSSGRIFPESFKTSPLLRSLLARLKTQGVLFYPRHRWLGWNNDGLLFLSDGIGHCVKADATVLAMGGASWPKLGSDGAWVNILAAQSIAVEPLKPANCGFLVNWSQYFREKYEGEPLKRIRLTFKDQTVSGGATITKSGLEGGGLYALSSSIREALSIEAPQIVHVDLRPDLEVNMLEEKLRVRKKGDSVSNYLRKAAGLNPVAIALLREVHAEFSHNPLILNPLILAQTLKRVPVIITACSPIDRAISTAGGVKFEELDDNLMLRKKPNIFVAGEMLDWEAPTGGYLLQASFATGVRAARGILKLLDRERLL